MLVDACKEYLHETLRSGSPNWLWFVATIAHAFSLQALLEDVIVQLVVKDMLDDSASTPLASTLALHNIGLTDSETAPNCSRKEQFELVRRGVAKGCRCHVEYVPDVLVVVVIMRMDQLAAGRPLIKDCGSYLDTSGEIVSSNSSQNTATISITSSSGEAMVTGSSSRGAGVDGDSVGTQIPSSSISGGAATIASRSREAMGSSSNGRGGHGDRLDTQIPSSSSGNRQWPDVTDDVTLLLLKHVEWDTLYTAEMIALINQVEMFPHETPAADYLRRQLLRGSAKSLSPPLADEVDWADDIAAWVEWPGLEDTIESVETLQAQDLKVQMTAKFSTVGNRLNVCFKDSEGKLDRLTHEM